LSAANMNRVLRLLTMFLAAMAIACTVGLLTSDPNMPVFSGISASAISAAPLLLIGASLLVFQAMLRPRGTELLKNLLLAGAFLLWGVVQLMEQSPLSKELGHVVIGLYVLELAWTILARVNLGTIWPSALRSDSPPDRRQPESAPTKHLKFMS
jgi:peptidoglycan/LPS O-acetylase OafA/YrhL